MQPTTLGILETSLYTDGLDRLEHFYTTIFGFPILLSEERMRALRVSPTSVLLLFQKGMSVDGEDTPRGHIPGHDGSGPVHLTFRIEEGDTDLWRAHLQAHNIPIISEVPGMGSGISLYFHDPDGHVLEIAPYTIWKGLG